MQTIAYFKGLQLDYGAGDILSDLDKMKVDKALMRMKLVVIPHGEKQTIYLTRDITKFPLDQPLDSVQIDDISEVKEIADSSYNGKDYELIKSANTLLPKLKVKMFAGTEGKNMNIYFIQ